MHVQQNGPGCRAGGSGRRRAGPRGSAHSCAAARPLPARSAPHAAVDAPGVVVV